VIVATESYSQLTAAPTKYYEEMMNFAVADET
jgi:hypothetical protein